MRRFLLVVVVGWEFQLGIRFVFLSRFAVVLLLELCLCVSFVGCRAKPLQQLMAYRDFLVSTLYDGCVCVCVSV